MAGLALAACSSPAPDADPPDPTPTASSSEPVGVGGYVALGDSYAAGPGIDRAVESSGTCLRSDHAYPALLAERLGADLTDVSCSGAGTQTVVTGRNGGIAGPALPPQLDALADDTELVTITLGGNDGVLEGLVSACLRGTPDTCSGYADDQAADVLAGIGRSLTDVLGQVRDRSPDATVLLVGYLRITPESGTCDLLGLPEASVEAAHRVEGGLEQTLAAAARDAGVTYVSMADASRGHDVCSDDPWVNGVTPQQTGDGIALHPRRAGMEGVAEAVEAALSR